uniref:Olfactory receptor n=1 Tax=Leptobrachium leishanense TaxID=445787 RepID=A0A8C5MF47_9ANUR
MEGLNWTRVSQFHLLGITDLPHLQPVIFVLFLLVYVFTLVGNLSTVAVVISDEKLHTPMYFFLGNLSLLDIFYSSVTVPKMLAGLVGEEKVISFVGCFTQLYFFHFLGSTEALLLSSMSYDRYVAICKPLRYHVLMGKLVCAQLTLICWLIGFLYSLAETVLISLLPFCKKNTVTYFFCDIKPLLKLLACADTFLNEITVMLVTGSIGMAAFFITVVSYVFIFMNLMKIHSVSGRSKAFSTCSSHITVVIFFYGTVMCTYLGPTSEGSIEKDKVAALLFTVVTPTLNPLIYTIRNQEVHRCLRKLFRKEKIWK